MQKIIINNKELNFIQSYIFNKTIQEINLFLDKFYIFLMILFPAISIALYYNESVYLIWINFALQILTIKKYEDFVKSHLFVDRGYPNYKTPEQAERILSKTWLINFQMYMHIVVDEKNNQNERKLNIIKNSSGHTVIEQYKKAMAYIYPQIIPALKQINKQHLDKILEHYSKTGEAIRLKSNVMNIEEKSEGYIKRAYAKAKGIDITDKFKERVIYSKSKEEVIKFLKDNFQEAQ